MIPSKTQHNSRAWTPEQAIKSVKKRLQKAWFDLNNTGTFQNDFAGSPMFDYCEKYGVINLSPEQWQHVEENAPTQSVQQNQGNGRFATVLEGDDNRKYTVRRYALKYAMKKCIDGGVDFGKRINEMIR